MIWRAAKVGESKLFFQFSLNVDIGIPITVHDDDDHGDDDDDGESLPELIDLLRTNPVREVISSSRFRTPPSVHRASREM
jgi:hypothetical protein